MPVMDYCSRRQSPLEACKHCGVKVHLCDVDDHVNNICPNVCIPCINHSIGCNEILERRLMSQHLQDCIASCVSCVRCTGKYERASSGVSPEGPMTEDYRVVFRRSELAKHFEDIHTVIDAETLVYDCPWESCKKSVVRKVPFNPSWTVMKSDDDVSLVVPSYKVPADEDATTDCGGSTEYSYSSACAEEHGEFRPPLHSGLSQEDELSYYGYKKTDITKPAPDIVNFPRQLSQSDELALYGYGSPEPSRSTDSTSYVTCKHTFNGCLLLDGPPEILSMIMEYLDPYSLRQLSKVSYDLREACHHSLRDLGVCQLVWQKTEDGWESKSVRYQYSTFTSYVGLRNWKLHSNFFTMPDHMQEHLSESARLLLAKAQDNHRMLI